MRKLAWLGGVLLLLSCTVNSSNLDVDASVTGTGGHTAGTGGASATGGAAGGTLGTGGQVATGGQPGSGGQIGTGGQTATGGQVGTGGQSATGGQTGTGGQSATGGHVGTGGRFGTGGAIGTGGEMGTGGQVGTGGHGGGAGGGNGKTCSQLESDYSDALVAAKDCTLGATNQCKQLADTSISCPGCQVYVNDTTALDALEAQWTDAGCAQTRGPCPAIACVATLPAYCSPTSHGSDPGSPGACAMAQPGK